MKGLTCLLAVAAFVGVTSMSTVSFAGEDKKDDKKGGNVVVVMGDDKKDDKKDKGGHVVFGDEKKDDKQGMGGK